MPVILLKCPILQISFLEPKSCQAVCGAKKYTGSNEDQQKIRLLQKGMGLNYQHHFIVDNMPVTFCFNNQVPSDSVSFLYGLHFSSFTAKSARLLDRFPDGLLRGRARQAP